MTKFVENINNCILVLLSPPHNETGRLCLPVVWRRAIYCRFHAFARSLGRARLSPKHEPRGFFLPSLSAAQRNREALPPCCVAEREGFEPPEAFTSTVFKTAAFDHSAISPYLIFAVNNFYGLTRLRALREQSLFRRLRLLTRPPHSDLQSCRGFPMGNGSPLCHLSIFSYIANRCI